MEDHQETWLDDQPYQIQFSQPRGDPAEIAEGEDLLVQCEVLGANASPGLVSLRQNDLLLTNVTYSFMGPGFLKVLYIGDGKAFFIY